VGDTVGYTITLTNTSSADTPALTCSISDPLLGGLLASGVVLASGANHVLTPSYVVLAGDADPLLNTATATCTVGEGFGNVLNASDGHSVDLFQPSITLDKTGDSLSKVGDTVGYTITLTNTSSADTPALTCSISDPLLGGVLVSGVVLASGANHVLTPSYVVLAGDADPLLNTATATCTVGEGFGNVLNASDGHSVNLFQPSITLVKTGPEQSKVGDTVTYTVTITNTGSADTPDLNLVSFSDTLVPAATPPAACAVLSDDEVCQFTYNYVVLAGDDDPLLNTASATYQVDGFPNQLTQSDGHSVNLFQPDYTLACGTDISSAAVGEIVNYTFTITNTGSADSPTLNLVSANDTVLGNLAANFPATLAPGQSVQVVVPRTVLGTDPDPLVNTLTTVYQVAGFPNQLTRTAGCSVDIEAGCALSPGFWGGGAGRSKWDQPTDPIAVAAGFTTDTPFPWVDPTQIDPTPDDGVFTYLDALSLSVRGDVTRQLVFKYVAARLNEAAFGVPAATADLLDEIDDYFDGGGVDNSDLANLTDLYSQPVGSGPTGPAKDEGQRLLGLLNGYFAAVGEENCPSASAIPEA
jgi:uncharacterized repeat protein (TIGR01451 family)